MTLFKLFLLAADKAPQFTFDPAGFVRELDKMGLGMLIIFILIGVIILATLLVNKLFSGKK